MKKYYKKPTIKEQKICLEDIVLISTLENNDIFDFDEEL